MNKTFNRGFTLIEMMVAIAIFSIVMLIATGAIFTIMSANKNSHALKSVLDNLNPVLETMARNARFGTEYYCTGYSNDSSTLSTTQFDMSGPVPGGSGCPTDSSGNQEGNEFAFISQNGNEIVYLFARDPDPTNPGSQLATGGIWRCEAGACIKMTAPEVYITNLQFYVQSTHGLQARSFMVLSGYALSGKIQEPFHIQTLISQRELNT